MRTGPKWLQWLILLTAAALVVLVSGLRSARRSYYHRIAQQALAELPVPPDTRQLFDTPFSQSLDFCGSNFSAMDTNVYGTYLSQEEILSFYDQYLTQNGWNIDEASEISRSARSPDDRKVALNIYVSNTILLDSPTDSRQAAIDAALSRGETVFSLGVSRGYAPLNYQECPPDED
jgi:hypothetical protein